jgi:50S ribosomal subunit-associated GTPase HflX
MGEYDMQMQTTLTTLEEMHFSSPYLLVMNKSENIPDLSVLPYGSIAISAKENLGIDGLKRAILQKFREEFIFCTLFVPYAQMNEYQAIKDCLTERRLEYTDDGAKIDAVIPARYSEKFTRFLADND